MTVFCDLALAVGLSVGGCLPPDNTGDPLPKQDRGVFDFTPLPPEPEPEPPKAPAFPPVVINKTIEKIVYKEAPPPPPPVPVIIKAPPAPNRDLLREAIEASQGQRYQMASNWPAVEIPVYPSSLSSETAKALSAPSGSTKLKKTAKKKILPPSYRADKTNSGLPVDNQRIVTSDRFISTVLETGINSQLDADAGGRIVLQVSRHVYGYHERNVLIPKGSRLECEYTSPELIGSSRLHLECSRILMAGHRVEIYKLSATGGDAQGRAGISGKVDNRFMEKYGSALMLSGISTAVRLATALSGKSAIADAGANEVSEKFGEITASVLEQTVNLAPIITIPQGTRIQIRPATDWYLLKPGQILPKATDTKTEEGDTPK